MGVTMEWPLLADLSPADRDALLATMRQRTFDRGQIVVNEGDRAEHLHIVEKGRLGVQLTSLDGITVMLNVLAAGSFFGELALLGGRAHTRTATVVALEPTATRVLSADGFAALRQQRPAIDRLLVSLLATRVDELSARLLEATCDPVERRVERRLIELVAIYGNGPGPVKIPLPQDRLAELVGATRPSVNQALQRLVAAGVVQLGRGQVTVLNPSQLEHG